MGTVTRNGMGFFGRCAMQGFKRAVRFNRREAGSTVCADAVINELAGIAHAIEVGRRAGMQHRREAEQSRAGAGNHLGAIRFFFHL